MSSMLHEDFVPITPSVRDMPLWLRRIYDVDPGDYRAQAWLRSLPVSGSGVPGDPFIAYVPVVRE